MEMLREKSGKPLKMAKFSLSCGASDFVYFGVLLSHLLLSQFFFQLTWCGSTVQFLPGFEGPLPFVLETGYVGVGEREDVQAFYYFIESESNPKKDPLMLWLTGGPGCSALSGLVFEIGPLAFKKEEYNGSLPNMVLRPHSWTKVSSIIFVDLPVSTGFTYARTEFATQRSDWLLVHQVHQFLRKWLIDHPRFLSNEVYIGGDSYSGIPIPVIVQEISQANERGAKPWINLQGYLLGNAATTTWEKNYAIPYAHGMGLISDELYDSYVYFLSVYWANDDNVRRALHIRKGSIGKWHRCTFNIPNKRDIPSSFEYHVILSRKGIRSLIYSGDHDMTIPFLATQAWIRSLNYSIVDDWRQWRTNGQVAGYTRTYSNRMTFATVKGGGHTAPEYRPEECFAMYSRWISNKAL
ncbi:serine carboxypeptidase-like 18 isoform X2 [Abrus precatorius]|uniref:Serine carboxypeptidase-like 18 isoform X2 n=1 Tax=Abrus precatorius TaxID=3816 RepID=A0A8B8LJH8_ABRPR|nr:serine carboxypeptidase-like 18 isoform X2 [Abrus precatorius]